MDEGQSSREVDRGPFFTNANVLKCADTVTRRTLQEWQKWRNCIKTNKIVDSS